MQPCLLASKVWWINDTRPVSEGKSSWGSGPLWEVRLKGCNSTQHLVERGEVRDGTKMDPVG
jgi:hypothetical protein